MKSLSIQATKRADLGKKSSKLLRREGNIPCVIYGGEEPIHFYAPAPSFKELIYTPNVYKVEVELDGKSIPCLMQDIQFEPVSDDPLHVDFVQLIEGKETILEVPVVTSGIARGVRNGGKLKVVLRKLKVKATPDNLPNAIEHDISEIRIGQSLRVSDLKVGKFEILHSPDAVLLTVRTSRTAVDDVDEEDTDAEATAEGGAEAATEEKAEA